MSSLDKFFRKKLEERSFPQDDLAWKEMETLLEDKEDRRPMLGWIFFLLGCAMAGATLFINATTYVDNRAQEQTSSANEFSKTKNIETAHTKENESPDQNEINRKEEVEKNTTKNERVTSSKSKQSTRTTSKNENAGLLNNNLQNTSSTNQPIITNKKSDGEQRSTESSGAKIMMKTEDVIQKGLPDRLRNASGNPDVKSETPTAENVVIEPVDIANGVSDLEINQNDISESADASNEANTMTKMTAVLDFLNKPFSPVDKLEEEAKLPGRLKKTPRFAAIRLGLRLEQSFIIPLADNREALILAAGPVFNYPINNAWSLDAGFHYKYMSADFSRADTVNSAQYSFGLKDYETSSSVHSFHYVGATLLVNRKVGHFNIGLGLEADRLLTIYGAVQQTTQLYPWEVTGTDLLTATVSDEGRLENRTETKWLLSPQVKISYDIRKRVRLSLGYKYQVNPIVEDSTGNSPFNKSGLSQLQAGFTYYFFNWKKSIK